MPQIKKLILLLNINKKDFFLFAVLFFTSSLLEGISIGFILPLSSSFLTDNSYFESILKNKYNFNYSIFLSLAFIFLIIFKNIFVIFKANYSTKNSTYKANYLSKIILKELILSNSQSDNSAKIFRDLNVSGRFKKYFENFFELISSIITISIILILLLLINHKLFLSSIIIIILIIYFILMPIKKKISLSGQALNIANLKIIENARDTIKISQEIRIFNAISFFTKKYDRSLKLNVGPSLNLSLLFNLPISIIEITFVIIFLFFIIVNKIHNNFDVITILPILSVYVIGLLRLIPAINSFIKCFNFLNEGKDSIAIIYKRFLNYQKLKKKRYIENLNFQNLNLRNISFSYGSNVIFSNVNLNIKKGLIYLIKGSSGSGKTTLLNIITGNTIAQKGKIYFNGKTIDKNFHNYFSKIISISSQNSALINDSLKDNICLGQTYNIFNYKKSLQLANISRLSLRLKKQIINDDKLNISGGQRQRICLARAYYKNSQVILLDEPTNQLDSKNEKRIFFNLRLLKKNKTIIICSHSKFAEKISDRIIYINNKKVSFK